MFSGKYTDRPINMAAKTVNIRPVSEIHLKSCEVARSWLGLTKGVEHDTFYRWALLIDIYEDDFDIELLFL